MSVRAGIVVTGTEVLTGRVADRNGPWVSERLRELGVDHSHTIVVGDRDEDMLAALRFFADAGFELIVTSGGLGPTEDDRTAEIVGRFQGRELVLDEPLERRIWEILEALRARWPELDEDALRATERKQAMIPEGSTILDPVGTAPGVVVPPASGDGPLVVVLPGPPRELQEMWPAAVATPLFERATAGATEYRQRMLRMYGIPESEIAATLRAARDEGIDLDALEITTCLRRGEIEVVTRWEPEADASYEAFERVVRTRHADTLFSTDGRSVDQIVADLLRDSSLTVACAESCTGGLLSARITELDGASQYFPGGLVTYANEAKVELASVDPELLSRHGAVSREVAEALADGARAALDAAIGVGITGIAGPGGGTPEKPVGTVWVSVRRSDGAALTRRVQLPGRRADVRDRSTTVAMHLLRRLLLGDDDRDRPSAASDAPSDVAAGDPRGAAHGPAATEGDPLGDGQ